jgi:hypothetical protein
MKKIMAGSSDACNIGAQCWHGYWNSYGTCMPVGTSCMCVKDGKAAYSNDCDPWVSPQLK